MEYLSNIDHSIEFRQYKNKYVMRRILFFLTLSLLALTASAQRFGKALKDTPIKVNSAHSGWVKTDEGGEYAPKSVVDEVKTIADLSILDENETTGAFI